MNQPQSIGLNFKRLEELKGVWPKAYFHYHRWRKERFFFSLLSKLTKGSFFHFCFVLFLRVANEKRRYEVAENDANRSENQTKPKSEVW